MRSPAGACPFPEDHALASEVTAAPRTAVPGLFECMWPEKYTLSPRPPPNTMTLCSSLPCPKRLAHCLMLRGVSVPVG